jgi:putative tricarboxylic transport membrane protein
MKMHDRISSTVLIVFALIVCVGSIRIKLGTFHEPGPGLIPFMAGVLLCLSSLLSLIVVDVGNKSEDTSRTEGPAKLGNVIKVLVALSIYTFLLPKLGYVVGTFFLMVFFMKGFGNWSWKGSVVMAIIVALATDFIFNVWLQCNLPFGLGNIGGVMRWISLIV